MFYPVYSYSPKFIHVLPRLLVFAKVYPFFTPFTPVYPSLPMSYPVYPCLPKFIHVLPRLLVFAKVYPFFTPFTPVYPSLPMSYPVYPCLPKFIHVLPRLLVFATVYPCFTPFTILRFQNGCSKVVIKLRVVQFWSEIILVISNRTHAARSFDFEITRMISDQITLHLVQLPSLILFTQVYQCFTPV